MSDRASIAISVVIATRRRARLLSGTLHSLATMTTDSLRWEIIVVDNGDDAATRAVVDGMAASLPIRLIAEPVAGKNRALNRALEHTAGELVIFTDDDVAVEKNWLGEMWAGADRWPEASMFGGRILPRWPAGATAPEPHPFHEHAYAIADFTWPEGYFSAGYVYGANMAIRSDIFRSGGRFDPVLGPDGTGSYVTGSESSLTVALERSGRRAVYLPHALVHHQIRPEQLTRRWLYGRAFRKGRAEARARGVVGGPAAVPHDLRVARRREYMEWWRAWLKRDARATLDHALAYWKTSGMIHHCRITVVSPPPAPDAISAGAAPR